jgi:DNA-binding transcriptional ArsR family regulator
MTCRIIAAVIEIRMRLSDLARMRFAYSPLAEVAESLYLLASGHISSVHRTWYDSVQGRLSDVNLELLRVLVPGTAFMPGYLFGGVTGPGTTIDSQLKKLAQLDSDAIREMIDEVSDGGPLSPTALSLLAKGSAAPRLIAEELYRYWSIAVEPHWSSIRRVLDDDVAYRAAELTRAGVESMLCGLHPEVRVDGALMRINKLHTSEEDLSGSGLVLVPSVFSWPNIIFVPSGDGQSTLTYAARGVGNVWGAEARSDDSTDAALGALIGRSRAAILLSLTLPHSTTELALMLGQSAPAVSQHLAVLKRSGLVTSWRKGKSVLYRCSDLAISVIEAHCANRRLGSA